MLLHIAFKHSTAGGYTCHTDVNKTHQSGFKPTLNLDEPLDYYNLYLY